MTNRMKKHRALQAKKKFIGTENGPVSVRTDLLVIQFEDGYLALQEWSDEEEKWITLEQGYLRADKDS